jgi:hypothetical protein
MGLIICITLFGISLSAVAQPSLAIDSYTLISKKRIDRHVYEYTYTATIINSGTDADAVKATFSINSRYTTVVDGEVSFGEVAAGNTVTSTDTYVIRQDRRYPFDTDAVTWSFFSLPPDPGGAGKETLLGIDSDNDGVRDDIQRYIYFIYPDEKNVRFALTQIAKDYQDVFPDAADPELSLENVHKLNCSRDCLYYIKGGVTNAMDISDALKAEILNTKKRSRAYLQFNRSLAGKTIRGVPLKERKNCCAFDMDHTGAKQ